MGGISLEFVLIGKNGEESESDIQWLSNYVRFPLM